MLGMIVAAGPAFSLGEPELSGPSDGLPLDIEPPILLQNLASDNSTLDPRSTAAIENDLAQARKRATSADRLFRAGIIAKVEAEQRALRVVQLEAMLAGARLEEARKVAAETGKPESEIAGIAEAARIALERRHRAESGRKSSSPLVAAANPTSIARKRSLQSCSAPPTNTGLQIFLGPAS